VAGAITALLGYAKSATSESFNPRKALQTIVVGGFIGGVSGFYGMTYMETKDWLSSIGAITLIEYLKKAIIRKMRR